MDVVRFENVVAVGLARVDAPVILTSPEVEERLAPAMERAGYGRGLLYQLTGIAERRLFEEGITPSVAAAEAGRRALSDAGVAPDVVGLLISTSVSKDYIEPSVASMVHRALGLPTTTLNFDVGNACLGFLNGVQIAGDMIERGLIRYGMVVNGESSREVFEHTVRRLNDPGCDVASLRRQLATLTLGSGAAAMVLGHRRDHPGAPRVIGAVTRAATEHNDLCRGQREWMETDAGQLLIQGIELGARTFQAAREHLGWSAEELDFVAAHQVSAVHTARIAERLGVDRDRFYKIYPNYGNVGPASIPIALSLLRDDGLLFAGARVALMGIGSGLNSSMMEIQW